MVSRPNACIVVSELYSVTLSESKHELMAMEIKTKLTMNEKNFILIFSAIVFLLQVAKIGTFFSIKCFKGKIYIKL